MSSTVSRSEGAAKRPRVPQPFRIPPANPDVRTAHTAVRDAAIKLTEAGRHHDAREILHPVSFERIGELLRCTAVIVASWLSSPEELTESIEPGGES